MQMRRKTKKKKKGKNNEEKLMFKFVSEKSSPFTVENYIISSNHVGVYRKILNARRSDGMGM